MTTHKKPGITANGFFYPYPDTEFTIDESSAVEELSGMTITDWATVMQKAEATETPPPIRALAGLIYVAMRRVDRTVTLEQVKAMKPSEFEFAQPDAEPTDGPPPELPEPTSTGDGTSDETSGSDSTESSEKPTTEETSLRVAHG